LAKSCNFLTDATNFGQEEITDAELSHFVLEFSQSVTFRPILYFWNLGAPMPSHYDAVDLALSC